MNIKKHIPNFLTCCNLLCGVLGIAIATRGFEPSTSGSIPIVFSTYLIFTACLFDFFDGFVARLLKVSSPIGKDLDSLADVVSFGVLPSMILLAVFKKIFVLNRLENFSYDWELNLLFTCFLIPVFSALRLAKFNNDKRQTESFIGLPTPANAILIASLPLIININLTHSAEIGKTIIEMDFVTKIILNPLILGCLVLLLCYLLVAELPLFALKFKNFSWVDNKMKYILLITAVVLLILLQWAAIPLIIFLYILLSFIENNILKSGRQKAD